jgi:hypothetical protein
MTLIEPNDFHPVSGAPVIFLAGPIHGAPPWQPAAYDVIARSGEEFVVATPRRFHSPTHYRAKATDGRRHFHRQRAWERYYMDLAARQGCILFWLPRPAGKLDGMVYGATTRYEIGLWSSRYSRDNTIGLTVGTDGKFPTVHTIAYDLEKEMGDAGLHDTLKRTVEAAMEIARASFARWTENGKPPVALESELQVMTTEELRGVVSGFLPDYSDEEPGAIISVVRELLDASLEPGPGASSEPVLSSRPGSQGAGDSPAPSGDKWFVGGRAVARHRFLLVGPVQGAIPLMQRIAVELGNPVIPLDALDPVAPGDTASPGDPAGSLSFCLRTAERVDVDLGGITGSALAQILDANLTVPIFWHTNGSMTQAEAATALEGRVPLERIIDD